MTTATQDAPKYRWWWTVERTGQRFEVYVIAWLEFGAIVIPDYPGREALKPISVRLSELTAEVVS